MNYFWVIENIDEANERELRCALEETLKENRRLRRVVKVRDIALKSKRNFELLTGIWL